MAATFAKLPRCYRPDWKTQPIPEQDEGLAILRLQAWARPAGGITASLESVRDRLATRRNGVMELQMDDRSLEYRIALRRFEAAFEALERVPDDDRQLLLREIGQRLLQQMPKAPSEERKGPTVIGIEIGRS